MNNSGYYEIGLKLQYPREIRAIALSGNVLMNRLHWHNNLEVLYCIHGGFSLRIDREVYRLEPGDFATINCDVQHEIFDGIPDGLQIILSIDKSLLRKKEEEQYTFSTVGKMNIAKDSPEAKQFRECISKLAYLMTPSRQELENIKNLDIKSVNNEDFKTFMLPTEEQWYEYQSELYRCLLYLSRHKVVGEKRTGKELVMDQFAECISTIHKEYANPINAGLLATKVSLSEPSIYRLFQKNLGVSLTKYIQLVRMNAVCAMLENTTTEITDIAYACGFTSLSNFYRVFHDFMGQTPNQYRKQRSNPHPKYMSMQQGIMGLNRFQSFYELPYTREDLLIDA